MCQSSTSKPYQSANPKSVNEKSCGSAKLPETLDFYTKVESNMLAGAVTILEYSVLIFATAQAFFSIVNPKVKGAFHYVLVLLPLSILIPAVVGSQAQKPSEAVQSVDD